MAIYTKQGDKGQTTLYSDKSASKVVVKKSAVKINAIGAIDETNSYLGIISSNSEQKIKEEIEKIQKNLFTIGAIIAGADLHFNSTKTKHLERQIDEILETLPVVKHFVLPGGTSIGAQLYYARTLVRKTERVVVALSEKEKIDSQVLVYINRLSDYLYILARTVNHNHKITEKVWQGAK